MAELKTKPTGESVQAFLEGIADEAKRNDAQTLLDLMRDVTGAEPRLWGSAIVGFGDLRYTYASGSTGDWFLAGFSPRKEALTLYLNGGFDQVQDLLGALGKHKLGKGCLYIKKLADVDLPTLRALITHSIARYPQGFVPR